MTLTDREQFPGAQSGAKVCSVRGILFHGKYFFLRQKCVLWIEHEYSLSEGEIISFYSPTDTVGEMFSFFLRSLSGAPIDMRRQFSLSPTITTVSWQSLMITTIVSICLHFPFPPNTKSEIFIYGWRFFLKTLMQKSCKAEHIFVHTTPFSLDKISATG